MFGYFRFYNKYASFDMQKAYKNYYCGTCFALEKHYGQVSRFLLSYDMALLAIMLSSHSDCKCDRIKCFGNCSLKKQLFDDEKWKKVAALNVLLSAEKFNDDINDEGLMSAKILKFVFSKAIKKAKHDYPETDRIIVEGYRKILTFEKENRNVLEIGGVFSDMMVEMLSETFGCGENEKMYIADISRWLYFIDALDDYDKDVKKGRFNPLVKPGVDYRSYINLHIGEVSAIIKELYRNFDKIISTIPQDTEEGRILSSIVQNTIPSVTSRILCNKELPKLMHREKGTVWGGASV